MMGWGNSRPIDPLGPPGPIGPERCEAVELVGVHLRVSGDISLLRFTRLSDLVNHGRGYVKLTGAQLLRRNGDPTGLIVEELMVEDRLNQEVRDVLSQHTSEMERSNVTYTEMFKMLKRKMAKEKGIIL